MALRYDVDITDRAYRDLNHISQKIFELSTSSESVSKWANLILDKIYGLDTFPFRNPNTVEVGGLTLWHVTVKHKYTIHYEILKDKRLVRVWRIMPPGSSFDNISVS